MTTVATIYPLGNPLPDGGDSKNVTEVVFEGSLSSYQVFKKLFPRLAELGHKENCKRVKWSYEIIG